MAHHCAHMMLALFLGDRDTSSGAGGLSAAPATPRFPLITRPPPPPQFTGTIAPMKYVTLQAVTMTYTKGGNMVSGARASVSSGVPHGGMAVRWVMGIMEPTSAVHQCLVDHVHA